MVCAIMSLLYQFREDRLHGFEVMIDWKSDGRRLIICAVIDPQTNPKQQIMVNSLLSRFGEIQTNGYEVMAINVLTSQARLPKYTRTD